MATKRLMIKDGVVHGFEDEICFPATEHKILSRRRVSRVVPAGSIARVLFRGLRLVFSDNSWVAQQTRRWRGQWLVEIGDEWFGPFIDRPTAIAFEKEKVFLLGLMVE